MLVLTERPDPATERIQACWLTELGLGEDRTETAMRFICASLNVLTEQESQGKLAVIVAERLRHMADRLDAMVVS